MVGQFGSKDKMSRQKKERNDQDHLNMKAISNEELRGIINDDTIEELSVPENNENLEISINYVQTRETWNQTNIVVDNIFSFNVVVEIFEQDKDLEPRSIKEWRQQDDWYKLKEATKKFDFTTKA